MNTNEIMGAIMRRERINKRMTMKTLGELTGFSEVAIHHYETGERGMSLETFFKVCKVLDLNPDNVQREIESVNK